MSRMWNGALGLARFLTVLGAVDALLLLGAVPFNGTAGRFQERPGRKQ